MLIFLNEEENTPNNVKMGSWSKEKIFNFQFKMKKLLIFEITTTHKTCKVKNRIKECNTALSVISSGLIRRLQPLGISTNKMFKESLRNKYVGYWIDKNDIKGSKSAIIEWIEKLWYSDSVIL